MSIHHPEELRQQLIRSLAEEGGPVRAVRIGPTYSLWHLLPGDSWDPEAKRHNLEASTLGEAVKLATPGPIPAYQAKGGFGAFVILETDERAREGKARHTLHFYTIKAKRDWRRLGQWDTPIRAAVPYAVHSGSLAMNAFEPRRPFSAKDDDPVTGRQPDEPPTIEVRP